MKTETTNTTVIYHRADFDGHFSAAVCQKFLPRDTNFIGWDFGDPIVNVDGDGLVYIVDLPPSCAHLENEANLIWIDHHKSSIEKFNSNIAGYRVDGVAACRLCWQYFSQGAFGNGTELVLPNVNDYVERRVVEPYALTLAGEYDVWDLRNSNALPFQYGLVSNSYEFTNGLHALLDCDDIALDKIISDGCAALIWQTQFALQALKERCYVREWEGEVFCVLASVHARSSLWFPEAGIPKECTAVMAWRYDGASVKFSLYHVPWNTGVDLSQIASKYGGGGHAGACGFEMPIEDAIAIVK